MHISSSNIRLVFYMCMGSSLQTQTYPLDHVRYIPFVPVSIDSIISLKYTQLCVRVCVCLMHHQAAYVHVAHYDSNRIWIWIFGVYVCVTIDTIHLLTDTCSVWALSAPTSTLCIHFMMLWMLKTLLLVWGGHSGFMYMYMYKWIFAHTSMYVDVMLSFKVLYTWYVTTCKLNIFNIKPCELPVSCNLLFFSICVCVCVQYRFIQWIHMYNTSCVNVLLIIKTLLIIHT